MNAIDSRRMRYIVTGLLAAGMMQLAQGIDLGPISVKSHIGEPLLAKINVSDLTPAEAAKTRVRVADDAAYRSKGMTRLPSHDLLNLTLKPVGQHYEITVSTNQMVKEPFINFVLSVDQNGKEMLREYAVFLDPNTGGVDLGVDTAEYQQQPLQQENSPVLFATSPASVNDTGWQGNLKNSKPVPEKKAMTVQQWQGKKYGPVKKGQTLFSIAEAVRPSSDFPVRKAMEQIYAANPRAFSSNSLDSLMAGYILTIPHFDKNAVIEPRAQKKPAVAESRKPEPKNVPTVAEPNQGEAAPVNDVADMEQVKEDAENASIIDDSASKVEEAIDVLQPEVEPMEMGEDSESEATTLQNSVVETEVGQEQTSSETEADHSVDDALTSDSAQDTPDLAVGESAVGKQPELDRNDVISNAENEVSAPEMASAVEGSKEATAVEPENDTRAEVVSKPESTPVAPVVVSESDHNEGETSFLNTTYAIFPMWQWLAIGGLVFLVLVLLLFKSRKKAESDDYGVLDQNEMDAILDKIREIEEQGDSEAGDTPAVPESETDEHKLANEDINQPEQTTILDDQVGDAYHTMAVPSDEQQASAFEDEDIDAFLMGNEPDEDEISSEQKAWSTSEPLEKEENTTEQEQFDFDELASLSSTAEEIEGKEMDDDWQKFINEEATDHHEPEVAAESEDKEEDLFSALGSDDTNLIDDVTPDIEENKADLPEFASDKAESETSEVASTLTVNPEEMEINLDLAASLIATGNGDRATTWLEEVIEMGTEEQKVRAKELLEQINRS